MGGLGAMNLGLKHRPLFGPISSQSGLLDIEIVTDKLMLKMVMPEFIEVFGHRVEGHRQKREDEGQTFKKKIGERILPEGWVDYSREPTPNAPRQEYGAQWWLNAGARNKPADRLLPDVPADAFLCQGFEGQLVTVIPSKKLVIVRLGMSKPFEAWDHNTFVSQVVAAVN